MLQRCTSPTKPRASANPSAHPAPTAASSKPRAASGFSFSRALKGAAAASAPANANAPTAAPSTRTPEPAAPSPTPLPAQTAAPFSNPRAAPATAAPVGKPRGDTTRAAPTAQPTTPWDQLNGAARQTVIFCLSWVLAGDVFSAAQALAYVEGTKPATAEEHACCVAHWYCEGGSGLGAAVTAAVQFLQDSPARKDKHTRPVPRLPKTTKEVAKLQSQIDQWLRDGEVWQAFPSQCVLAVYGLWTRPEHADTLQAVLAVADSAYQREEDNGHNHVFIWLLDRAYYIWGLRDPRTRRLVNQVVDMLCRCEDPRRHADLLRLVTRFAQELPGGLGWGSTVVAPVPDEEAFFRHAFMESKGIQMYNQGHYKLAMDMAQRCEAYYDTLGSNWLAVARKTYARSLVCRCTKSLQGPEETEALARRYKREAVESLGPNHPAAISAVFEHGLALMVCKRHEQGMSILQQCTRMRQSVLGRYHTLVFFSQVRNISNTRMH